MSKTKFGNDVQNANALTATKLTRFANYLASALWYLMYINATKMYCLYRYKKNRYTIQPNPSIHPNPKTSHSTSSHFY